MTTRYTTQELAEKLETTPKKLRRFLRAEKIGPVGKGHRYAIEARNFRTLKKQFVDWSNEHTRTTTTAA